MAVPIRPVDLPAAPGGVVAPDSALIFDDGDGVWKATPSQVLDGAGGASFTALAADDGSSLLGFIQAGTDSVVRTAQAKMRERLTVADKDGTFLDQLEAIETDLPDGGLAYAGPGAYALSAAQVFANQRMRLVGQNSTISFDPASPAVAITYNSPDAGGMVQASFDRFSFTSSNSVAKTAFKAVNVAAVCSITNLSIANSAWLGSDSIGIRTEGRDTTTISDNIIGCAYPLSIGANASFPTLAADHFRVHDNEFISTSATGAAIVADDGVSWSTTSFERLALVGGLDGFRHEYTDVPATGVALSFSDTRVEQGLDSAGWSYTIGRDFGSGATLNVDLINALWSNCILDGTRNGIRTRNIQLGTLVNTVYVGGASDGVAFDIDGVPGSLWTFVGCRAPATATVVFSKLRCALKLHPSEVGAPIGPYELWQYFNPTLAVDSADYTAMSAVSEGDFGSLVGPRHWRFPFSFPVGDMTLALPGCAVASMDVDVTITAKAANSQLVARYQKDGTLTIVSSDGIFSGDTPTSGKIYLTNPGSAQVNMVGDAVAGITLVKVRIEE